MTPLILAIIFSVTIVTFLLFNTAHKYGAKRSELKLLIDPRYRDLVNHYLNVSELIIFRQDNEWYIRFPGDPDVYTASYEDLTKLMSKETEKNIQLFYLHAPIIEVQS